MTDRLQQLHYYLDQNPGDPFLIFAIAKEWEREDSEKALHTYLELRAKHPDYTGLYYHLGKLYAARGASAQAAVIFDEGIEIARSQGDRHAENELRNAREDLD